MTRETALKMAGLPGDTSQPTELGDWPGRWMRETPTVEHHPKGRELAWVVRGHPFTRPVLAKTNVGVTRAGKVFKPFVVVQIMADGFYGRPLHATQSDVAGLEWLGPILMPNAVLGLVE